MNDRQIIKTNKRVLTSRWRFLNINKIERC